MRRPGGYGLIIDPDPRRGVAGVVEFDTFTCAHCQFVVRVPVRAAPSDCGGWCGPCAKPICGRCAAAGVCTPWEQQMERAEARARLRQALSG